MEQARRFLLARITVDWQSADMRGSMSAPSDSRPSSQRVGDGSLIPGSRAPIRPRSTTLVARGATLAVVVGALALLVHRVTAGDSRTIVVTPAVRAELERRFRDQNDGRSATAAEMGEAIRQWERDEALYREALREGLDRSDASIRIALADRMRARATGPIATREPTDADLDRWLASHRRQYESELRYDYAAVSFPRSDPDSPAEIEGDELALNNGADTRMLARPATAGQLTARELARRFGAEIAAGIQRLPIGRWHRLDGPDDLMLVRVKAVEGGLPRADDLRRRMIADWTAAQHEEAQQRAVQAIVDRYRIEDQR
jgi:hypothetical protein